MKLKIILFIFFAVISFGCNKEIDNLNHVDETAHGQSKHFYYTCTMHPQVHEHKPGNCPICGMPLVKVTGSSDQKRKQNNETSALLPTDYQKKVLQLTQGRVERKNVSFEIVVGGRFLSATQVAFYIYESDLMRVKVGQQFEGECVSMPGITLVGKIIKIDNVADPSSRSVRVVGTITSPHPMILMEGSFFGKIKTTPVSALMIPYDAVLRTGKENIVYKIQDDGGFKAIRVSVGLTSADQIEVISGLNEGDLISFGPNFLIDSESRLKGTNMMNMEGHSH
jgi:hypothetical protein